MFYMNLDGELYKLSHDTTINQQTCLFEWYKFQNLEVLDSYSLAYRGNRYDEWGHCVEVLTKSNGWFHRHVFGKTYNGHEFVADPEAFQLWDNRELLREIVSRWRRGAVVWLECTNSHSNCKLVEYIANCKNPVLFTSALGGIIVISDEPDRPGDTILRVWPVDTFNGQ